MINYNEIIEKLVFFKENIDKNDNDEIFEDYSTVIEYARDILQKVKKKEDPDLHELIYFELVIALEEEWMGDDVEDFYENFCDIIDNIIKFIQKKCLTK